MVTKVTRVSITVYGDGGMTLRMFYKAFQNINLFTKFNTNTSVLKQHT